jgi:hypothetical protein
VVILGRIILLGSNLKAARLDFMEDQQSSGTTTIQEIRIKESTTETLSEEDVSSVQYQQPGESAD